MSFLLNLGKQTQVFNCTHWEGLEVEEVSSLPWNIDGEHVFKLACNTSPGQSMKSTVDGRPWACYNKSYRKGFNKTHGKRLRANCKGCHECVNKSCAFRMQFKKPNRFSFNQSTEGLCCKECGLLAVYQACHAVKVWEFLNDNKGYVYVYDTGTHNCSASNKPRIPAHKLQELIHHNPNVKPQQAANQIIMNAIRDDASREELDELSFNLLDPKQISNLKQKEKLQGNPCGKRVDHLIKLKQKCEDDLHDKYFIYKVNVKELNGGSTYVFKTSKERLQLAISMSNAGQNFLSE